MRKKLIVKGAGVFLLVSAAVQVVFADTAGELRKAERLFGAGQYAEAE